MSKWLVAPGVWLYAFPPFALFSTVGARVSWIFSSSLAHVALHQKLVRPGWLPGAMRSSLPSPRLPRIMKRCGPETEEAPRAIPGSTGRSMESNFSSTPHPVVTMVIRAATMSGAVSR
uniref:Putative secreted protein n=1 Tax=Anopheles darlingi TaxID=43151 RepID=A0A2M4DE24_ANODA